MAEPMLTINKVAEDREDKDNKEEEKFWLQASLQSLPSHGVLECSVLV